MILTSVIRAISQLYFAELRRSMRTAVSATRDHFFAWNNEWKDKRYDTSKLARPVPLTSTDAPAARPVVVSAAKKVSATAS
jgi:hypothetical protein